MKFKDRLITEARINHHPYPEQFADGVVAWCEYRDMPDLTDDTSVTPDEFERIMDMYYTGSRMPDGTEY